MTSCGGSGGPERRIGDEDGGLCEKAVIGILNILVGTPKFSLDHPASFGVIRPSVFDCLTWRTYILKYISDGLGMVPVLESRA